jgi:hypothetical protein
MAVVAKRMRKVAAVVATRKWRLVAVMAVRKWGPGLWVLVVSKVVAIS